MRPRAASDWLRQPLAARVAIAAATVLVPFGVAFLAATLGAGEVSEPVRHVVETEDQRLAFRHHLGLDRVLVVRPVLWLLHLATGDFGASRAFHRPALAVVMEAAPDTARLLATALLLSVAIGLPLGWIAASRPQSVPDRVIVTVARSVQAVPAYLIVLIGIVLWLRLTWTTPVPIPAVADGVPWAAFVLALLGLVIPRAASIARSVRADMIGVLRAPFIAAARQRGVPEAIVRRRYALLSALPGLIETLRGALAPLVGAAVLVEPAASLPGLGRVLIDAVTQHDYPVITAWIAVVAGSLAAIGFLIDTARHHLDPRPPGGI